MILLGARLVEISGGIWDRKQPNVHGFRKNFGPF